MANKRIYVCNNCGNEYPKWQAMCTFCNEIDSLFEQKIEKQSKITTSSVQNEIMSLENINENTADKVKTEVVELDRILQGGLTKGSFNLLAGLPGIGKSTLLLNLIENLQKEFTKILYVSGEESLSQIKQRTKRMELANISFDLYAESNLEEILPKVKKGQYQFIIIDSIQTMYIPEVTGMAGGISQVKNSTLELMRFTKNNNLTTIIVGHVTKDGDIAGPKHLEHMVDTVIYIEGEKQNNLRFLNITKNRFGPTDLIGVCELTKTGIVSYLEDNKKIIKEKELIVPGVAKSAIIKGNRTFFYEIQTLLAKTNFGYPKRTTQGIDLNRVQLIIALIQKKLNIDLQNEDCFVKIVGDLKVTDSTVDLALIVAILSEYYNLAIKEKSLFVGEIGLTGEIIEVGEINKIIEQAANLGFTEIYISADSTVNNNAKIKIKKFSLIEDLVRELIGG